MSNKILLRFFPGFGLDNAVKYTPICANMATDPKRTARIIYGFLTGSFVAVVMVAAIYWLRTTIEDRRLEPIVSQLRTWKEATLPLAPPVTVTLKTRCSSSRLYYQLRVESKDKLAEETGQPKHRVSRLKNAVAEIAEFELRFRDDDGFEAMNVTVKSNELVGIVNESGHIVAYEASNSTYCDKLAYSKLKGWTITWQKGT